MISGKQRRKLENGLRMLAALAVLSALVSAVLQLFLPPAGEAQGDEVHPALLRWSAASAPRQAHVRLASAPDVGMRDWLVALQSSGTTVTWQADSPQVSAITVEPVADPRHPLQIRASTTSAGRSAIRDGIGPLGSSGVDRGGGVLTVPWISGSARLDAAASDRLRDELKLRPLLLLGAAGWESKFMLMALEERGWQVDARLGLSPRQSVRQGANTLTIDKEHYAAVILFEAAAAPVPAILEFVRSGGGLIVIGAVRGRSALQALLPSAQEGPMIAAQSIASSEPGKLQPREALALQPLEQLIQDSVALEKRGPHVAVAVRRFGEGRVLQVGYRDTWRWRMAAREVSAVDDHRIWWSALVSQVAYAPRTDRSLTLKERVALDPAPMAATYQVLGAPKEARVPFWSKLMDRRLTAVLFALALLMMYGEWASRRLRGVS